MSKLVRVMFVCWLAAAGAYAQVRVFPAAESGQSASVSEAYPVCGSVLLAQQDRALAQYALSHPEMLVKNSLRKTSAWGFNVGDTHTWYAHDFTANTQYQTSSTCRAVGTNCYVFVEDAKWNDGSVTQAAVDSVVAAFDQHVPANGSKGVYQMDVDAFGNPPDVDSDPRIIILILDIKDGWSGSGGYVAGYFHGLNEYVYAGSNQAEIYYLDANPLDLKTSAGLKTGMGTTAHEFQHMIHFNYDNQEMTFFNEGCSELASVNCGYGMREQNSFSGEPNHYLLDWRTNDNTLVLNDYSRAARFTLYLRDRYDMSLIKKLVQNTLHGIAGLDAALSSYGSMDRFADLFPDWLIANILDDRTVDPHYGYVYPNLKKVTATAFANPNQSVATYTAQPLAAQYFSFTGGSDLKVTVTSSSSSVVAKMVEIGSPSQVKAMTSGNQVEETGFGSAYKTIHVVVMNTDQSASGAADFTVQSSGTYNSSATELAWESGEPTGYLSLAAGDTACVTFNGTPGARLDSIRVALRRAGPIYGQVWTKASTRRPMGSPLSSVFTATGATNPPSPYPVPWPNWASVDLTSQNIDASNPFAVAFGYTGAGTTGQRIMTTQKPVSDGVHSYTYYTESSSVDWYYFTSNSAADSMFVYLVRAYVSFPATAVNEVKELLPSSVNLMQNYPNPFNPVTTIGYTVGGTGDQGSGIRNVKLSIYNVLGQEVAVLVNERQAPGRYTVRFDAGKLPSGIYLYRLQAGNYVETKRMLLLK